MLRNNELENIKKSVKEIILSLPKNAPQQLDEFKSIATDPSYKSFNEVIFWDKIEYATMIDEIEKTHLAFQDAQSHDLASDLLEKLNNQVHKFHQFIKNSCNDAKIYLDQDEHAANFKKENANQILGKMRELYESPLYNAEENLKKKIEEIGNIKPHLNDSLKPDNIDAREQKSKFNLRLATLGAGLLISIVGTALILAQIFVPVLPLLLGYGLLMFGIATIGGSKLLEIRDSASARRNDESPPSVSYHSVYGKIGRKEPEAEEKNNNVSAPSQKNGPGIEADQPETRPDSPVTHSSSPSPTQRR